MFGKMKKIERKWMVLLLILGIVLVGNSATMNSLPANAETTIEESNNAQTETSETEVTPTEEPHVQEEEEEEIIVAKPEKTKITYGKCKKAGTYTIKWKKVDCDGYEIGYSKLVSSGGGSHQWYSTEDYLIISKTKQQKEIRVSDCVKKVKIRIRAYKKIDGEKVYSSWSKKKQIKIKRRKYKNEPKIGTVVAKESQCKNWEYYGILPLYKWDNVAKKWSFDYKWESFHPAFSKKMYKKMCKRYLNKNKKVYNIVMKKIPKKAPSYDGNKRYTYWQFGSSRCVYIYMGDGR